MPAKQATPTSLLEILADQARRRPRATAIMAPDRSPLSYAGLLALVRQFGVHLRGHGVSAADRVAIVMPNGPEMATAFVAVAAVSTAAPLNPAYREAECDFFLSDLRAKALVVSAGVESAAITVARRQGIQVLELSASTDAAAGQFTFSSAADAPSIDSLAHGSCEDTALLLHTSGTTARPKIVPLSHRNLCTAAQHIAETIRLTPSDRGLSVMPLFHVHGLVGSLLSSLWAGGSVVCTPGFSETKFFEWVASLEPTWYTAVPTMHQAIVRAAGAAAGPTSGGPIRLARSASWALPPITGRELSETLGVPVIEAYGMTEAANQICSNPLPPGDVKYGSVGLPAGPDVAVMDPVGRLMDQGEIGEVVIRGANVTRGYENNPEANTQAFTDGWFRTGDIGYFDDDGYLFLEGRSKELINRGGEKVSPREVDEALMEHPDVWQAAAFAVPHPTLGQDVAAAVVPKPTRSVTEQSIRAFAFERLTDFKVPSRIVVLDEIPKGPTGKVQRLSLAERLADKLQLKYREPGDDVERALATMWKSVLQLDQVGGGDNFFALGGDSLRGTQVMARVEEMFNVHLPITTIFLRPTVEELAAAITSAMRQSDSGGSSER